MHTHKQKQKQWGLREIPGFSTYAGGEKSIGLKYKLNVENEGVPIYRTEQGQEKKILF